MHFYSTARRDDIFSVVFLLLYLLRGGSLLNVDLSDKSISTFEQFKKIRLAKDKYTLKDLCPPNSETEDLFSFIQEVFSYRFPSEP